MSLAQKSAPQYNKQSAELVITCSEEGSLEPAGSFGDSVVNSAVAGHCGFCVVLAPDPQFWFILDPKTLCATI